MERQPVAVFPRRNSRTDRVWRWEENKRDVCRGINDKMKVGGDYESWNMVGERADRGINTTHFIPSARSFRTSRRSRPSAHVAPFRLPSPSSLSDALGHSSARAVLPTQGHLLEITLAPVLYRYRSSSPPHRFTVRTCMIPLLSRPSSRSIAQLSPSIDGVSGTIPANIQRPPAQALRPGQLLLPLQARPTLPGNNSALSGGTLS